MQRKFIKINTLNIQYHPLVTDINKNDSMSMIPLPSLSSINRQQLATLLACVTLHVIQHKQNSYQLLHSVPVFDLLCQHPGAKQMDVQLLIYTLQDNELLKTIETLQLIAPALHHRGDGQAENIHARYHNLKKQGYSPTSLTKLAALAGLTPSAFRKIKR